MAEFRPVDIKRYLHDPRKPLDRIDRITLVSNSVNSVKPVSGESSEKNNQGTEAEGHASTADNSIPLLNKGTPELGLHGPILLNLLRWIHKFNELTLEYPSGMTVDATPEASLDLMNTHPWGVVYDPERYLLLTWGDVPTAALLDKRDLLTDEPLVKEKVAA